ncbi:MAG TPA: 2-phospho-L-lactate transferase [Xanthobacteraceae bacterium]|nr:2-phospho-L-lactate transferase [Xanthobacteraceae bacterium]
MMLALAGGVGGAKLAAGLAARLPPDELLVVVNTGDDFLHFGLHVAPDVDTVMYWLAGCNDPVQGWGVADDSWNCMSALEALGGPTWFRLGDRDLAVHLERTRRLHEGQSLSQITRDFCARLKIAHHVVPMTDEAVRTIVHTTGGPLAFQDYFVRLRCEPRVTDVEFQGAKVAMPSPAFNAALSRTDLAAVIICPSNPLLSIAPILALADVHRRIATGTAPVVAVSPIVAGAAIKGPAAKIFAELGREVSAVGVAQFYGRLIDGIMIDEQDADLAPQIEAQGIRVCVAKTVMKSRADQAHLAQVAINFAASIAAAK